MPYEAVLRTYEDEDKDKERKRFATKRPTAYEDEKA
jgi:hypothetical protein